MLLCWSRESVVHWGPGVVRETAGASPCLDPTQCRINHVADVANATGLRPRGGGPPEVEKMFSARQ